MIRLPDPACRFRRLGSFVGERERERVAPTEEDEELQSEQGKLPYQGKNRIGRKHQGGQGTEASKGKL
jgi:hypothetical protein